MIAVAGGWSSSCRTLAMASIAGLYGNFTSQEDGGGGRSIFVRGIRIGGDKKSENKKSGQSSGPQDPSHLQTAAKGNDEWVKRRFFIEDWINHSHNICLIWICMQLMWWEQSQMLIFKYPTICFASHPISSNVYWTC